MLSLLLWPLVFSTAPSVEDPAPTTCDVLIAGGSTAALAAALTAAAAAKSLSVCLTEPTDELGGQLAFNPAIDYGSTPKTPSKEWASLVSDVTEARSACRVSRSCYNPAKLDAWVRGRLAALPNLHVLLRTTVRGATRNKTSGNITALHLISRRFKEDAAREWESRVSDSIADWYDPDESPTFAKRAFTIHAEVIIEASELGDVLYTAGIPHTQGVELPTEASLQTDDNLTQSACFTFYMELLATTPAETDPAPPGAAGPLPFWQTLCCCSGSAAIPGTKNCSWAGIWSYRRSTLGTGGESRIKGVNIGDVSMQNWGHGNDMSAASIMIPDVDAKASAEAGEWAGGVNTTAIRMMEDRAYGWYHAMAQGASSNPAEPGPPTQHLVLNRNYSGTLNGLSKFPYLRDTRRAVGLGGFRLLTHMMRANGSTPYGERFVDRVGVGGYNFDVKPGAGFGAANGGPRRLPGYMWNKATNKGLSGHAAPFYFPLRALTVDGTPNVLTAGKTIAMSFAANTAAREHLDEWSCGVASGAAAAMMARRGWGTSKMLDNVAELQELLRSGDIRQPLEWGDGTPKPSPAPHKPSNEWKFSCGFGRCFSTPRAGVRNSSCNGECPRLAAQQWLANAAYWNKNATVISARIPTVLKKSELPGAILPPEQRLDVKEGFACRLQGNGEPLGGYYLCSVPAYT